MASEQRHRGEGVDPIGVVVIAFSAIVVALGMWAIWQIFDPMPTKLEDLVDRTELARNVGLFALALIGLPLAIWRSLTASRQTQEAIAQGKRVERQLELSIRQITATEESNLAKLLQDGAKLLADSDGANVTAGIATLSVVARTEPEPFGTQARIVLLDFVQKHGATSHVAPNVRRAISALEGAYLKHSDAIAHSIRFEEDYDASAQWDDYDTQWKLVRGSRECTYVGGRFVSTDFDETLDTFRFKFTHFQHCTFERLSALKTNKCTFSRCLFEEVDIETVAQNTLTKCDLSGVRIVVNGPFPDLREGNNYFKAEQPPIIVGSDHPIDLTAVLHEGEPQPVDHDF